MTTDVINLHGKRDNPLYDPAHNPNVVCVGDRQWWGHGRLLERHPLYNPYKVKKYGRGEAVRLYREHLFSRPDLLALLPGLRGKVLACWCDPEPCHAHLLAELADGPLGDPR